jgi:hypothetical protein
MIQKEKTLERIEQEIQRLSPQQQLRLVADITKRLSARPVEPPKSIKRDKYAADLEKIKREQAWWMAKSKAERLKYAGEYIAVHNQTLIDHDSDRLALSRRIRAKYGKTAVLMMPAEGPREIRIYSTRLVRDENSI